MLHTVNMNVVSIIALAHQVMDKEIKVILLQQDQAKTKRIINQLRISKVRHETVPEYCPESLYRNGRQDVLRGAFNHFRRTGGGPGRNGQYHQSCAISTIFRSTCLPAHSKFAHGLALDQHIHREIITQAEDAESYQLDHLLP